jgi:two-component system phosphate regulon sensor histidine kinase PhoR
MDGRPRIQIQKFRKSFSLTGAIVATAVGVLVPVLLSALVGIVAISIGRSSEATLFGVLIICFTAAALGGAIVVTVLLSRRARLARLQADLLSNMTHELRTPLTAIRMYAQTLQMGRIDDDPELIHQSAETILRETEWLESSIDRVLTWRAASRDRDVPVARAESMSAAVHTAVQRFARMLAPDEVDFEARIESEKPVFHDPDGIQSVVLNLLVNAYKYTGNQKRIRLGLVDVGDHVELWVEDNGIGIPRNEAGKIFDPFYRVDSRLRGKSSGAGLGLAIVRHQVAQHRARIYVESELNRGARFVVQFPVSVGDAGEGG